MPQSSDPGPVPLPIATTVSTPAARARSSIADRSAPNCSISGCAWESTNKSSSVQKINAEDAEGAEGPKEVGELNALAMIFFASEDKKVPASASLLPLR